MNAIQVAMRRFVFALAATLALASCGPSANAPTRVDPESQAMKVKSSLKSLKARHRACRVVRRKGRVYVINKVDPRYKAKQG